MEETPSLKVIPRLFVRKKIASSTTSLLKRVYLAKKAEELLQDDDVTKIAEVLKKHESEPMDGFNGLNYADFCAARDALPEKCRRFFTATIFSRVRTVPLSHRAPGNASLTH